MIRLVDFYDADLRTTNATVRMLASDRLIPHPLPEVMYADGHICDTTAGHVRTDRPCPNQEQQR